MHIFSDYRGNRDEPSRWGRTATCLRPFPLFLRLFESTESPRGIFRKKLSARRDDSPRCRVMQPRGALTHKSLYCATGDDLIIAGGARRSLLARPHPETSFGQTFLQPRATPMDLITLRERVCMRHAGDKCVCLCNAIPADLRFFCSWCARSLSGIQIRDGKFRAHTSTWHWSLSACV